MWILPLAVGASLASDASARSYRGYGEPAIEKRDFWRDVGTPNYYEVETLREKANQIFVTFGFPSSPLVHPEGRACRRLPQPPRTRSLDRWNEVAALEDMEDPAHRRLIVQSGVKHGMCRTVQKVRAQMARINLVKVSRCRRR
jgi:hypothetical protein